ncbi:MAG: zinc ABC transporter substrate-binding protein [Planctomycetia bacterium]|nr:zinc ABC transporter substrate-binding protein [Planctomycetia bacterium]
MTCPSRHAIAGLLIASLAMVGVAASAEEPLGVFVSIPPQALLVQRIGGQRVTTEVLVRPGQDPHTFEPAAKQMVALARARVFFTVGLPFEEVLVGRIRANYRRLSIVDSALGIKKRRMDADEGRDDGHGEEDHAEPAGADPHVWLSPAAIKTMAANIAKALGEVDPAHAAEFDENLKALLQDVDARDAKIRAMLAPYRGRAVYVYHPAFGYFCDAYGLEQRAVETGGKSPAPRQLRELIKQAKADGVKVIFVQRQFDQRGAQTVAQAIGGAVVPVDPLAEDVLGSMEAMARAMAEALRQ